MERISLLLQKIETLQSKKDVTALDIDLMMDYMRVIYADMIEWRSKIIYIKDTSTQQAEPQQEIIENELETEPTLEEITQVIELKVDEKMEEGQEEHAAEPLSDNIQNKVTSEDSEPIDFSVNPIPQFPFPKKTHEDIRKFIGINEKFVFINELFDGNRDAYEEVLSELSEFLNIDDAIKWLKNTVIIPYGWKEDDFNVQDFYRILGSYYKRIIVS